MGGCSSGESRPRITSEGEYVVYSRGKPSRTYSIMIIEISITEHNSRIYAPNYHIEFIPSESFRNELKRIGAHFDRATNGKYIRIHNNMLNKITINPGVMLGTIICTRRPSLTL